MFYDRKVKYLDYCENGVRVKGCGVVKVQVRDRSLGMEVMVSGLLPEDSFQKEILVCIEDTDYKSRQGILPTNEVVRDDGRTGEYEIGKINIEHGKGSFRFQCENIEQLHNMENYHSWAGIRIALGGDREIKAIWKRDSEKIVKQIAEKVAEGMTESAVERVAERETERGVDRTSERSVERVAESTATEEKHEIASKVFEEVLEPKACEMSEIRLSSAEITAKENSKEMSKEPVREGAKGVIKEATKETTKEATREAAPARDLAEDKWEQLWNIYPHISPFRDKREYLSIRPADFVIFSAESYKTINNSFLLHGFYNYHHLILTHTEKKGERVYYVGVPGNYFEREKQVAIMFGFESFECEEEPAQAGDFGYYMIRAQL